MIPNRIEKKNTARAFNRLVGFLIRASRIEACEKFLDNCLSSVAPVLARACNDCKLETLSLADWSTMLGEIEFVTQTDKPCTAIGISLSGYGDGSEPAIEVSYYTEDAAFDFINASQQELLYASRRYGSPWLGRMSGRGDYNLTSTGLANLYSLLRQSEDATGESAPALTREEILIGQWFLFLRFYQLILRHVEQFKLARPMPVLIGVHGQGPWIEVVVMGQALDANISIAERALNAKRHNLANLLKQNVESEITQITEMRQAIRTWSWFSNRDKRQRLIELRESHDMMLVLRFPELQSMLKSKSTWKMSDSEFADFIEKYRLAKANQ